MVRAAAKNYKYVTIVVDPKQYDEILERIKTDTLTEEFRLDLSRKAFLHTGLYDCAIADYLTRQVTGDEGQMPDVYCRRIPNCRISATVKIRIRRQPSTEIRS